MIFSNFLKQAGEEMRLRNYSPRTIKVYLRCLAEYFQFLRFATSGDQNISSETKDFEPRQILKPSEVLKPREFERLKYGMGSKRSRVGLVFHPHTTFIKQFLLLKHDKGQAPQTINLFLNAIKFFYHEVLKTPRRIDISFAKRTKKIPVVLSRNEISASAMSRSFWGIAILKPFEEYSESALAEFLAEKEGGFFRRSCLFRL